MALYWGNSNCRWSSNCPEGIHTAEVGGSSPLAPTRSERERGAPGPKRAKSPGTQRPNARGGNRPTPAGTPPENGDGRGEKQESVGTGGCSRSSKSQGSDHAPGWAAQPAIRRLSLAERAQWSASADRLTHFSATRRRRIDAGVGMGAAAATRAPASRNDFVAVSTSSKAPRGQPGSSVQQVR